MSTRRSRSVVASVSPSQEANNLELMAADVKAQIGKLESGFQKQLQKVEAENTSLKACLQTEKNKNNELQKTVKNLQEKLLESKNSNKKMTKLIQTVRKGTGVMNKMTAKMQQQVLAADSTAKLVQQLYSRVEADLRETKNKKPAKAKKPKEYRNNSMRKRKNDEPSDESCEEEEEVMYEEEYEEELDEECSDKENKSDGYKSDTSYYKDIPEYYQSGNFVLLKSDVKWDGDNVISKLDELNLMKIEGKALLQKYIPMISDGKILHKITCVYIRWNVSNRNNYYSVTELLDQNPTTDCKDKCVTLDLGNLIKVRDSRFNPKNLVYNSEMQSAM